MPFDNLTALPRRRHRSQQLFSKGVLSAHSRDFGAVPVGCDPLRCAPQLCGGRVQRMSHWTTPT